MWITSKYFSEEKNLGWVETEFPWQEQTLAVKYLFKITKITWLILLSFKYSFVAKYFPKRNTFLLVGEKKKKNEQ